MLFALEEIARDAPCDHQISRCGDFFKETIFCKNIGAMNKNNYATCLSIYLQREQEVLILGLGLLELSQLELHHKVIINVENIVKLEYIA